MVQESNQRADNMELGRKMPLKKHEKGWKKLSCVRFQMQYKKRHKPIEHILNNLTF